MVRVRTGNQSVMSVYGQEPTVTGEGTDRRSQSVMRVRTGNIVMRVWTGNVVMRVRTGNTVNEKSTYRK